MNVHIKNKIRDSMIDLQKHFQGTNDSSSMRRTCKKSNSLSSLITCEFIRT